MRPGRRAPSLDARLAALGEAADLAAGRLPAEPVERARAVVERAGARAKLSPDHTAAALAGATGSGKSSLFNALSGTDLADVGVTRPTTSAAQAARWDPEGSGPLLDWLDVPRRHTVEAGDAALAGLVLLDLPDHDSIALAHRLEVDRLVGVVDLLVWVLDPQKYADAAVHDRYLKPLARHRDVMVVVLNQVDRLPEAAVARCLDDLRGLLADDGLDGVPVLPVSARTGQGMPELRALLADRVAARRAWASRLAADAATAADGLAEAAGLTGETPPKPKGDQAAPLAGALADAAGVPQVVTAVAKAYRHRAATATGWPATRWLRRFRADPLRRLRVEGGGRTSLPASSPVQRAGVELAVREVGARTSAGLPEPWAGAVREAARAANDRLPDELDKAIATTSVDAARRPRWWGAVRALQWAVFAVAIAGLLWLTVLFAFSYLRLPDPPTPELRDIPWPTVLLIGGVLAGVLLALLARLAALLGARRRARKADKALRAAVAEVGERLVLAPAEDERARFTDFTARLTAAR
ncbi:50S ribosome-binding GTPase [Actinomadura sp. PM05-2]|uniref:50S ribosome-binding GTPase n=1 Tax=Actinomadura parmotrematis TaxID=2864039 RepID=A0ABS7G3T5_9ACTN|nr:50S ribosome-binding GTPase [Actinomadura parmotrematis]